MHHDQPQATRPRVAFVTSHPIQYQVPVFRCLAECELIDFQVLYAMLPDSTAQGEGFGVEFAWDLPLLEGYKYRVLENVSTNPSVTRYSGCDTPSIRDVLSQQEIDVVVVNGWVVKTCLQTLRACKRFGIPCIVRGEANLLRPRPRWKKALQRQLIRRYDAYLPIGTASREFYRSHGIKDSDMFDAKYCIENDRFEKAAVEAAPRRAELRERWSVAEGDTCFLFCGKFEEKKHPLELLIALETAIRPMSKVHENRDSRLHLLMVGDGQLRVECETYAKQRKLPVTFAGFLNQSEIVDSYVASDCLVLPSDHGETWGLVVNEAMACGRPAITSDQVGCTRDLIHESITGRSFPFGDWDALANCFVELARDPEKLTEMGESAKKLIADFSPLRAADGIVDAVHHCLRKS
jgi:glycosyltransferase involved in cell wall biosynthesis